MDPKGSTLFPSRKRESRNRVCPKEAHLPAKKRFTPAGRIGYTEEQADSPEATTTQHVGAVFAALGFDGAGPLAIPPKRIQFAYLNRVLPNDMQIQHIEKDGGRRPYPDVTGVILAGGHSVRMGRDKATLKWGECTLFERVLRLMEHFFDHVLIAGDRPDLAQEGVPAFADPYPGSALGGLFTGLLRAPTPWIFAAPCDMPCAHPELVRLLLARRAESDIVVPRTPEGPIPVFGLYRRVCREPMQQMLEEGRLRIVDLYPHMRVDHLDCQDLPLDWERALCNINTPGEFMRLQASGEGRTDSKESI